MHYRHIYILMTDYNIDDRESKGYWVKMFPLPIHRIIMWPNWSFFWLISIGYRINYMTIWCISNLSNLSLMHCAPGTPAFKDCKLFSEAPFPYAPNADACCEQRCFVLEKKLPLCLYFSYTSQVHHKSQVLVLKVHLNLSISFIGWVWVSVPHLSLQIVYITLCAVVEDIVLFFLK